MTMEMFAVLDTKAGVFLPPVTAPNNLVYVRLLQQQFRRDPEHVFKVFSADYKVFRIGTWNSEDGALTPLENIEEVINLTDIVEDAKENE